MNVGARVKVVDNRGHGYYGWVGTVAAVDADGRRIVSFEGRPRWAFWKRQLREVRGA